MLLNNRYTYVLLSIINEKNVLNLDIRKYILQLLNCSNFWRTV